VVVSIASYLELLVALLDHLLGLRISPAWGVLRCSTPLAQAVQTPLKPFLDLVATWSQSACSQRCSQRCDAALEESVA